MGLIVALLGIAAAARAGDDTVRMYGTWKTSVLYNGQMVTVISVHDESGFKNYVVTPSGNTPYGQGAFSAANGRYTTSAPKPNDSGIYHFINENTMVATNSAGQTAIWKRDKTASLHADAPAAPVAVAPVAAPTAAPTPSAPQNSPLPPETNAAIAAFNRKDYNTAWSDFMAAAQQGDSEAEAGVGSMLFMKMNPPGTGFYAQSEKWLLASAKQNNVKGMTWLARFYYADGVNIAGGINPGINNARIPPQLQAQAEKSFAKARDWYERASALGDGYAMGNLAIMLDAGVGGPRDPARAAQLRAGVGKHADADFAKKINADPTNNAITASWQAGHYTEALQNAEGPATKGDAKAQAILGRAYYEGVGVPRNYATALRWLTPAVKQNNSDAMFILGLMYEHGRGINQDFPKSLELFDHAAQLGQRYAEMEAAGMRLQGEANRQAALAHRNSNSEDIACETAGGISSPGACIRGGENIDPFNATENESH